jgi:hypothetical protein
MNKNKLVSRFIIGTFVSLYILVSTISTIHVIDFFELSNSRTMAIALAIAFELGAAASLASLVIMDKMNKTLVWTLFITITLMQMNGNLYYTFTNLADFQSWSELFNLIEEEPLYQKRILSFVSGAILPLVALGFIKSLVDYIKPQDEEEDEFTPTDSTFDSIDLDEDTEKKNSQVTEEDIMRDFDLDDEDFEVEPEGITEEQLQEIINKSGIKEAVNGITEDFNQIVEDFKDWDSTLEDGLEEEEWDEDHALDQVMNDMASDMDSEDDENPKEPVEELTEIAKEEEIEDSEEWDEIGDLDEEEKPNEELLNASKRYIETQQKAAEIIDELDEVEDPLLAAKRRLGRERMQQFLNIKRNGNEPTN